MSKVQLAIVGAGPAGLAAAAKAYELGLRDIVIIERDYQLGGILQQCVHDGFGLHRFGKQLNGSLYAQHFIDKAMQYGIKTLCNTMVLQISPQKQITAINAQQGVIELQAEAIVLAAWLTAYHTHSRCQ